jgi:hypothetical protein
MALTPLPLPKIAPVTAATNPQPKSSHPLKPTPLRKSKPAVTEGDHQEIHGSKNAAIHSTGKSDMHTII